MPEKPKGKSLSKKAPASPGGRLVLLDAHAIIHRAYHALPEFSNSKGEPTGALYGLVSMLLKIIEDLKPDYLVAAFDLPEKTHRHEAYEAYKGTRRATDKELEAQLERAKDVFAAWNIPVYSAPGFEADDVLGTIVRLTKPEKNLEVIIASGDMDTLQLVEGRRVRVYTLRKGLSDVAFYDEAKVKERYGFGPKLLPDLKGIMGDPSDNIVGVPGVGEGSALKLVQTLGTVEKILAALKKRGPEAIAKEAGIQKRYAELVLAGEEEALFSKTLATIRTDAPIDWKLPKPWREALELEKLLGFLRELEFRTMPERVKRLLGGSAGSKEARSPNSAAAPLPEDKELELAVWVLDSNLTNPKMDDVFAFTKSKSIEDARRVVEAELDKRGARGVFEEIERPLMPVVEEMNRAGIKVDKAALLKLSKAHHRTLASLEKRIWKLVGEEFNLNSPRQLRRILFEKLGLGEKRQKKTAGGALSTKESELVKLRGKHEVVGLVLEYRELQKLLSTYIDSIPEMLGGDSRLHSTFIQAGTTTGRMASQNPNLQNIPIRTELGREIRKAFIAERGSSLISLDYSQIELRIAAILSKDEKLIEIFREGVDVHTGVAMRVFGVSADEVDKAMRIKAKTINFGVLFGMGVNALKQNLGTDRKEAQEFYDNYFKTFSTLAEYLDSTKAEAAKRGYTETLFGRRRYFSGLRSPLPYIRAQAERMAINAPIQGTEADIVKIAMRRIADRSAELGWQDKVRPVLQVHDEIVYEAEEGLAREAALEYKGIMESVLHGKETYGVPIVAEAHIGQNWNDMERL